MGASHKGIPLNKIGDSLLTNAPILTPAEKPVCVQRGLLQLFDTQAIDEIGLCLSSRAHHWDFSVLISFGFSFCARTFP